MCGIVPFSLSAGISGTIAATATIKGILEDDVVDGGGLRGCEIPNSS